MKKIWKDVIGYENYQVSNYGEIKTMNIITKKNTGYIFSKNTSHLSKNGKKDSITIANIVAKHFIPNKENKKIVLHKDFNPKNNRISNLMWVTGSEKMKYLIEKGRIKIRSGEDHHMYGMKFLFNAGEKNSKCKLSDKQVLSIREKYKNGETQVSLAKKYRVSQFNISRIVNRQNRTNI